MPFRRPRLPDSILMPRRWRRGLPGLLLVFLLAALAVWDRLQPAATPLSGAARSSAVQTSDIERYHDRTFRVVHVVDGDTLDIDAPDGTKERTRIRLWGVDTPEIAHNKGETDMYYGPQARDFAVEKLQGAQVQVVLWTSGDTRDRFGRLLAYVFLERGGEMFNRLLIDEGLAYADPRFDHPWKQEFREAEDKARKSKRGLWADVKIEFMPKWRQKRERELALGSKSSP